jgi:hypothetical protein
LPKRPLGGILTDFLTEYQFLFDRFTSPQSPFTLKTVPSSANSLQSLCRSLMVTQNQNIRVGHDRKTDFWDVYTLFVIFIQSQILASRRPAVMAAMEVDLCQIGSDQLLPSQSAQ